MEKFSKRVEAIGGDPERKETAIAILNEAVSDDEVNGVIVVAVGKNGEHWSTYCGDISSADVAFVATRMIGRVNAY